MSRARITAIFNPVSGGGAAAHIIPRATQLLRTHDSDLIVEKRRIPDAAGRRAAILESTANATHVFIGGGDGTIANAIGVTMQGAAGPQITSLQTAKTELGGYAVPEQVKAYVGVGMGSAQDVQATVGFPKPKGLARFLDKPEGKRDVFDVGALWMVHKDNDGKQVASLALHSITAGVVARVFQRYDNAVERFRAKPGREDTPLPIHLGTIVGRFLQGIPAGLNAFLKPNVVYSVHKKGGEEKFFPSTAGFAVFPMLIAGATAGLPDVYPIAGDDFRALVVVLTPVEMLFIAGELMARGTLAKKLGFSSLIGPDAGNWSISLTRNLRRFFGMRDDRFFTITHDDEVRVKMFRQTSKYNPHSKSRGLEEGALPVCLNGDNLPYSIHEFLVVAGHKDQTFPMMGASNSVLGKIKQRVDAKNLMLEQKSAVEDAIRKRFPSWRDYFKRTALMRKMNEMSARKWQRFVRALEFNPSGDDFAEKALDGLL